MCGWARVPFAAANAAVVAHKPEISPEMGFEPGDLALSESTPKSNSELEGGGQAAAPLEN